MKQELLGCLQRGDFEQIERLASKQKRTLSLLTGLTCHPDKLIAWRAVEALGLAARVIGTKDMEYVRVHLRRLIWLVSDESGGIGWRAPEGMGEIIANCPDGCEGFIAPLFHLLELEEEDVGRFRAGVLWAIGRVCSVRPEQFQQIERQVLDCLDDPDPQVRGMALWALRQAQPRAPIPGLERFLCDFGRVEVYQNGSPVHTTVSELARSARLIHLR